MTAHAKLSASGSSRWLSCSASVRMEADLPDVPSEFAEHGTAAHELAERCLRTDTDATEYQGQKINDFDVDEEMVEAVQVYLDFCRALPGHHFIEQRVDFSPWVPEGFGTSDFIAIDGHTAHIIDLKYGAGVRVDAENNSQAMLYALGALNEYEFIFDDIDTFNTVIIQPRLDHISEASVARTELMTWAAYVKDQALLALSDNAPFNPSEKACQWCKAAPTCAALSDFVLSQVIADFDGFESIEQEITFKDMHHITPKDIATVLPHIKLIKKYLSQLEEHAVHLMETGTDIPGYKLVEGRSLRQWRNEEDAETALRKSKLKVADIFTKKLISVAQAEKKLGKTHPILTEEVTKPEGKPTLAPVSDKRPAIEPLETAFEGVDSDLA